MIGKRETSISVTDLQDFHNVSDSIKRLAISIDGHPSKSLSAEDATGMSGTPRPNFGNGERDVTRDVTTQSAASSSKPPLQSRVQPTGPPIQSILSNARADFSEKYELLSEIGRGGFSTVYQCRDRLNANIYAVKVCHHHFLLLSFTAHLLSIYPLFYL